MQTLNGKEIGFVESFALASDRGKVLEQLVPGTEEYYFYSCLHAEQQRDFDTLSQLLNDWVKHLGRTALFTRMEARQQFLQYDASPQATIDYICRTLQLRFDHQPPQSNRNPHLATTLDPSLLSRDRLATRALQSTKTTAGFTEYAFDWLLQTKLTPGQRRHLLERLTRPDYEGLADRVVEDLKQKDSRGFGSLPIHALLLKPQLDRCLELMPTLLNEQAFVDAYLTKLAPSDDLAWRDDHERTIAYLERLWEFAEQLDATHNSLKAQILFQRLTVDRAQGHFDKTRFMKYLLLPRQASYVHPRLAGSQEWRRGAADLNYTSPAIVGLTPIGVDEPLVRSYLQHFFLGETDYQSYASLLAESYVKRIFAETKIMAGLGDVRTWYALLRPEDVQQLKERVELDFLPTNPKRFKADEEVTLELSIKNVKQLIVRVFRINTENYYRQTGAPVNTNVELDGLVPNEELSFEYDEPSERRVTRSFTFPQLKDRGVYVIDFIGNGVSSRAVVRKGALRYLVETSAGGQRFTILDDCHHQVKDARLWLGEREYKPESDGTIVVPFTTRPGQKPIVITHAGFADVHQVRRPGEDYRLQAAFYVDRESLLRHHEARILVRPRLLLNRTPIGIHHLTDVSLHVTSTDHDGTQTTQRIDDFQLFSDRESSHFIQVPARLQQLQMELRGQVEQLSTGKTVPLSTSKQFSINAIDQTANTEDLHLVTSQDQFLIEVLGRSGERRPQQIVELELQHRDFTEPVRSTLQTDDQGQIRLGRLAEVVSICVTRPGLSSRTWRLPVDQIALPNQLYGIAGKPLRIPLPGGSAGQVDISLLRLAGDTPVADASQHVEHDHGYLMLSGLIPGEYALVFKQSGQSVRIRVIKGIAKLNHALGENRYLELGSQRPLVIQSSEVVDGKLRVQLDGTSPTTRVHVFATRYQPAFNAFEAFHVIEAPRRRTYQAGSIFTSYAAGRDIGDEYRYVLERKYADKFPGNLLARPSLLLNPWAIHETQTQQQTAKPAAAFAPQEAPGDARVSAADASLGTQTGLADASNLDFLTYASEVVVNLQPDDQGVVAVDVKEFPQQQFHVLALDSASTCYQQIALPVAPLEAEDLRLTRGLDPQTHYAQQKQVTVLAKGDRFVIPDITTATFDYYDSLPRAYQLFNTVSPSPPLGDFEFVTRWSSLSTDAKRELYTKYACHELHYFLMRRDPDFFQQSILPYLANKKDKTFLDRWFLKHDVQPYYEPWEHARLNVFEQILLGQRTPDQLEAMQRYVDDLLSTTPPNVDRLNHLFATALRGRALDARGMGGGEVVREMEEEADQLRLSEGFAQPMSELHLGQRKETLGRRARARARRRGQKNAVSLDEAMLDQPSRDEYRRLYLPPDRTKEWVENNYYQLPLEQQNGQRVCANKFWQDFAEHQDGEPFLSAHWAEASHNFTEMMLALAALDLPFEAAGHQREFDQAQLTLVAASPMIVFHQQIEAVEANQDDQSVLVSQNYFRHDDRYETVDGIRREKCVTDEFLVNTVYGCQVVVTNPTSVTVKADVLLQVPQGAIPVQNSRETHAVTVQLAPFASQSLNYAFYFPVPGQYRHFPVHVSDQGRILGFADPTQLSVVKELSKVDKQSWNYVSQFGTNESVLAFLRDHNVHDLRLGMITFRMKETQFYHAVLELLRSRQAYEHVLWSYSLKHHDLRGMNEYLAHANGLVQQLGPSIDSKLLMLNPIQRGTFQHREYWPLVNARAHQLGGTRQILNDRFHKQYHDFMDVLAYQTQFSSADHISVTYAMVLQDRIGEAIRYFDQIDPDEIETDIQYDYLSAYLDCFRREPSRAPDIVARYVDYPIDRWRERFEAIGELLAERQGEGSSPSDDQATADLADTEPSLEVALKGSKLELHHRHLEEVEVNYYLMDLELLFSRNPFVTEFAGQFSHIFPNQSRHVTLDPTKSSTTLQLPEDLWRKNVLVEVTSSCGNRSRTYYANTLLVEMINAYGQIRVRLRESNEPLAGVYIKTYAMMKNGEIKFYKDGYTDLTGKFDYSSLSTDQLDQVKRFAVLIMSDEHGAVVRETDPPSR